MTRSVEVEIADRLLSAASADEVGAVHRDFGDRLLVHPARNLVVIKGGCDGLSLSYQVLLTDQQMAMVAAVLEDGAPLERYLGQR